MIVIVNVAFISERFWLVPACEPSTLLTAFLDRFQSACLLAQQLPAMKPEQLKSMVWHGLCMVTKMPSKTLLTLQKELRTVESGNNGKDGLIICRKIWSFCVDVFSNQNCSHVINVHCFFAVFDWGCYQCYIATDRGRTKKKGRDSVFWTFGCPGGCVHRFSLWLGGKVS